MKDANLYIARVLSFDDVTKDIYALIPQLQGTTPVLCQAYLNDTEELETVSSVPPGERVLVFFDGGDLNSQPYWMLVTVGLITTNKLSDEIWEGIPDGAITETKIFSDAVVTSKIRANAVKADQIDANAVTTAKLDANAVTTAKLDALAVTAEKIAAGTITGDKISATTTLEVGTGTYKVKAVGGVGTATYLGITSAATPTYNSTATPFYAGADQRVSIANKLTYASGVLTVNGNISGGSINIGGSTAFYVDASGNMWTGASTYAASAFRVSAAGALFASSFNLMAGAATRGSWATGLSLGAAGTMDGILVDSASSTVSCGLFWPTGGGGNEVGLVNRYTGGTGRVVRIAADYRFAVSSVVDSNTFNHYLTITQNEHHVNYAHGEAGAASTGTSLGILRLPCSDVITAITTNGGAATKYAMTFHHNDVVVGTIFQSTTGTGYATSSDYRLKENVAPLVGGVEKLLALKPSEFNFISEPGERVGGFIAHEVGAVVPYAVSGEKDAVNEDGTMKIQVFDASKLVPILTAAMQEQQAMIWELQDRVADLEN